MICIYPNDHSEKLKFLIKTAVNLQMMDTYKRMYKNSDRVFGFVLMYADRDLIF